MKRAKYIGEAVNIQNTEGSAYPAHGFHDEDSAEFGAFLYEPDGGADGEAFYVDPERDLEFTE